MQILNSIINASISGQQKLTKNKYFICFLYFFSLAIILFSASGCSTQNISPKDITQSGRLSISSSNQDDTPISAGYSLEKSKTGGHLLLLSPLGSTLASLSWTSTSATLQMNGESYQAESLNDLLQKLIPHTPEADTILDWLMGQTTSPPNWDVRRTGSLITAKHSDLHGKITTIKVLIDK